MWFESCGFESSTSLQRELSNTVIGTLTRSLRKRSRISRIREGKPDARKSAMNGELLQVKLQTYIRKKLNPSLLREQLATERGSSQSLQSLRPWTFSKLNWRKANTFCTLAVPRVARAKWILPGSRGEDYMVPLVLLFMNKCLDWITNIALVFSAMNSVSRKGSVWDVFPFYCHFFPVSQR